MNLACASSNVMVKDHDISAKSSDIFITVIMVRENSLKSLCSRFCVNP